MNLFTCIKRKSFEGERRVEGLEGMGTEGKGNFRVSKLLPHLRVRKDRRTHSDRINLDDIVTIITCRIGLKAVTTPRL